MIRDEFKNQKQPSSKEARKKASMGEKNYYAKKTNTLQDLTKSLNGTNKFMMVILSVFYAVILFAFITTRNAEEPYSTTLFIVWTAVYLAFVVWFVLWFTVIKKRNEEKIEECKKELERISLESLTKIGNAYKIYGAEYMEKIRKEQEERAEKALKVGDNAKNEEIPTEN